MTVGENLNFNMARMGEIALDQHTLIAERRQRLALGPGQFGCEISGCVHHAHPLATTAGTRLDQHRIADASGLEFQQFRRLVFAVIAGHQRHARFLHQRLRLALATHRADGGGRRADEHHTGFGAGIGKGRVLGQEAIARMHRLRAGAFAHVQDHIRAQIALPRWCRPDVIGLVGHRHMHGMRVGVGIHCNRRNAEFARRADDPAGDFATVGDKNFAEHRHHILNTPNFVSAIGAFSAADRPSANTRRV